MRESSQEQDQAPQAESDSSAEDERDEGQRSLEQLFLDLHLATENMGVVLRKPPR